MTQSHHEHDYAHESALELLSLDAPQEDAGEGEKSEILCPQCIISAKAQKWDDIGHVDFLRLKNGRYLCPACGEEWDTLNDVMTTFIEELLSNNQGYEMYTALRRKVKNDLKGILEEI